MRTGVVWFRRDLRVLDNPAWIAATRDADRVVALLVLDPALLDAAGEHRRQAFLAAVGGLDRRLRDLGGRLRVEAGDPRDVLPRIVAEVGATSIDANRDVSPHARRRDEAVDAATGGLVRWHWGTLVHPPGSVLTKGGTLSRVFTPFWRRWETVPVPSLGDPDEVDVAADPGTGAPASEGAVDDPDDLLADWQTRVERYDADRDPPGIDGTSRLSTALRFGTISPGLLATEIGTHSPGREAFVRQLAWRDWYAHTMWGFPDLARRALRSDYDSLEWEVGPDADRDFEAWADGRTGYPIVDAGMRQLAATGWMHNRVRMITASFLVKHLLIDWRRGERHFRRLLVDGDPAQNAGNWQWVAGTGADAAPYFRIFNPIAQSRRFDAQGAYVRTWVPELAGLDDAAIHAPWEVPPLELAAAGVVLGETYPAPIVDHAAARERTLAAYSAALGR